MFRFLQKQLTNLTQTKYQHFGIYLNMQKFFFLLNFLYFSLLVDEIEAFDTTRMSGNEFVDEEHMEMSSENEENLPVTKDYKYTSLNKSVCVLEEFFKTFQNSEFF